jgi:hypothetical protein
VTFTYFVAGERVGPFIILEDSGFIEGHPAYLVRCTLCGNVHRRKRSKILRDKSCGCAVKRALRPKTVIMVGGRKVTA